MKESTKWRRTGAFRALLVLCGIGVAGASAWPAGAAAQDEEDRRARRGRVLSWNRPMLGVQLNTALDRELESVGVQVHSVWSGSSAAKAGVEDGDVIVSFDGHDLAVPLDDAIEREFEDDRSFPGQRLIALLEDAVAGEPVELVVRRDGENHALSVTPNTPHEWTLNTLRFRFGPDYRERLHDLGDRVRESRNWRIPPVQRELRARVPEMLDHNIVFGIGLGRVHGLDLVKLNPGLGAYFGTETGVLVADADEDSPLGLSAGDVVVGIDGRDVEDEEEFRRILHSYEEGDEIEFRIWRDGEETTVSGTVE